MAAIVDYAYYNTVYLGREVTECDFAACEARAEDIVGMMTRWAATADTIASLPPFQRALVKKAICAQVDWFGVNGLDSIAGSAGTGFTVGKVSVSGESGSDLAKKGALAEYIAPMCIAYLEQSGLMRPQVALAPDLPLTGGWPPC